MKILLTALIVLGLFSTTAQAGALAVGGHGSVRNSDAGPTGGLFASVMFGLPDIASWAPDYGEFAYEASGEGAEISLTRLGGHWALLEYPRMDFTVGGGAVIRALGVQATNVGAFAGVGAIAKDSEGEPRYGASVYSNFDLPDPRPTWTITTYIMRDFKWPF